MSQELEAAVDVHDGPPIEPDGPYGGKLSKVVTRFPGPIKRVTAEVGGMASLLCAVMASAVREPRGYWSDVLDEMHFTITRSWLSISVALFGFLVGLSVPSVQFVVMAGVGELYGPMFFVQAVRSFSVWVATLLVAGVIGAAMTAELGSRKVREELDAMQVMGIDPIRALVLPRVVSVTLISGLLAVPTALITVLSMQFAAWFIGGIPGPDFYLFLWTSLDPLELVFLVVNCGLAGLLIGTVCCHMGLSAEGGAMGLGRAVNRAVVISFMALFVMQLGFNSIVLGFFPGLGGLK